MNKPDTEIEKKGIVLIQSLNESDKKTGTELARDVLQFKSILHDDFFLKSYNVKNKLQFVSRLLNIESGMKDGEVFTLHLETHGSHEGIHVASGECISWSEFFALIRPINIKMGHLLLVVMSMCSGSAMLSHIEPEKRAPYRAFIGAHRIVSELELLQGFSAFYQEYTNLLDIDKSIKALHKELSSSSEPNGPFRLFGAEQVFEMTFDANRDRKHFEKTVEEIYNLQKAKGKECTLKSIEKEIRGILKSEFLTHRSFFCFADLYDTFSVGEVVKYLNEYRIVDFVDSLGLHFRDNYGRFSFAPSKLVDHLNEDDYRTLVLGEDYDRIMSLLSNDETDVFYRIARILLESK